MNGHSLEQARPAPAATSRYALLTMDDLGLLIPQHQVHALEPGFDVQREAGDETGWIAVAGALSPVYCVSRDLEPVRRVPAGRHICVLLDCGDGLFGVLCDQVTMLDQAGLEVLPLPECMRTPHTPLQGLVLQGEQVLCVSSARNLLACVGGKRVPADATAPFEPLQGRAS